jgi:hypothetical protein
MSHATKIIITLTDHGQRLEISGAIERSESELANKMAIESQKAIVMAVKGFLDKNLKKALKQHHCTALH